MSPISVNLSRKIPTGLEINGPILSFIQQPESFSACSGNISTSFVGFATALFPEQTPANPAQNIGSIGYQWYEVGVGPLSDSERIVGSATSFLTLVNLTSPDDSEREFFLRATHNGSGYGIGSSTPIAQNSPLDSNIVSLTIFPSISISTQPIDLTVGIDRFAEFAVGVDLSDTRQGNLSYQWTLNGSNLVDSTNVQGSNTDILRIQSQNVGINTVQVIVTHPTSCLSPLYSEVVSFNVVEPREILRLEGITNSSTAIIQDYDLSNGQFEFDYRNFDSNLIYLSFYSLEKPIELELDMYGAKGSNNGPYIGGNGGYSRIRVNMNKNEEFILSGFTGGSLSLYRKSKLIAAVGAGGDAGTAGNGGSGGGVNLSGIVGAGKDGGTGGNLTSAGQLTLNGIFGSKYNGSSLPKATAPSGGLTISCSKGDYWVNRGFSPCADIGTQKFYLQNGTEVTNTSSITRGFKPGYTVTSTGGLGLVGGGNGGNGATGGTGGRNGAGGGGGSGYTDGSSEIVRTLTGDSTNTTPLILVRSRTFVFDVEFDIEMWGGKGVDQGIFPDLLDPNSPQRKGGLGGYTKLSMIVPSNYTLQVRPSYYAGGAWGGGVASGFGIQDEWMAVVGGGGGAGSSTLLSFNPVFPGPLSLGVSPGGAGSGGYGSGDPAKGEDGSGCSGTEPSRDLLFGGRTTGGGGGGAPRGLANGEVGSCNGFWYDPGGSGSGGSGGGGNIRIYRDQSILDGYLNLFSDIKMTYVTHSNGVSSAAKVRITNKVSGNFVDYTTNSDVPLVDISNF